MAKKASESKGARQAGKRPRTKGNNFPHVTLYPAPPHVSHPTDSLIRHDFFPAPTGALPFGEQLNAIFFPPVDIKQDFPVHGPNVVRMCGALLHNRLDGEPGLLAGADARDRDRTRDIYIRFVPDIRDALGIDDRDPESLPKMERLLSYAALYHDIGKKIRRANHPQIGFNILRNFNDAERNKLVQALAMPGEPPGHASKHNRFSLICSITQHHDKFGVISTGEGSLPILSDILYFTSDYSMLAGIKKNVTSVMLVNLADIAAVCPLPINSPQVAEARQLALEIAAARSCGDSSTEAARIARLTAIIKDPACCLGLSPRKVWAVLNDWKVLMDSIEHDGVRGNRGRLKRRLLEIEQNPARTIERVLRLLMESSITSRAQQLTEFMDPTRVESVLVGALGSHEFQVFCERFARVVKLDYGLNFFKAIVCACVRVAVAKQGSVTPVGDWKSLSAAEQQRLDQLTVKEAQSIAGHVTALFVKVLNGLVTRYSEVLDGGSRSDPRRFGFQMRDLTSDEGIRDAILNLLCIESNMDHVALTWIADEVTIWSLD